jgi:glycosyltransferase involved in cell wall biosynthesis
MLVVVDDASDEKKVGLEVDKYHYFPKRVGIAKSKNKCLELLEKCDHIFLFDDDFYPIKEGWEQIYIDTAQQTGIHHLCFTFDFGQTIEEFKKIARDYPSNKGKIPQYRDDQLQIMNEWERRRILEFDNLNLNMMWHDYFRVVRRVGLKEAQKDLQFAKDRHELKEVPILQTEEITYSESPLLKYHIHPNGVMMYLTKKCLKTIGGFNSGGAMYGGEHGGFSVRAYNNALTPHPFVDVNHSRLYFVNPEFTMQTESSVTTLEKEDSTDTIQKFFNRELESFDFFPYK